MFITRLELKIALCYLKVQKFRGVIALLSFFGVTIGVATLIVVTSVMNGFHAELFSHIANVNGHVSIVNKDLQYQDFKKYIEPISKIEDIKRIAFFTESQSIMTIGKSATGVMVKGAKYQDIIAEDLIANKIIEGDATKIEEGAIIGSKLASDFLIGIGDEIGLISPQSFQSFVGKIPRVKRFKVVAIFSLGMAEYDSTLIYTPFKMTSILFGKECVPNIANVYINNIEKANQVAAKIKTEINPDSNLYITNWQESQSSYYNALKVEKSVMFVILTMIIIVAAFNIISSLFMLVEDKKCSIAILRTIGMTRASVVKIFILCGAIIGLAGALFGNILGIILAKNIEKIKQFVEYITKEQVLDPLVYNLEKVPYIIDLKEVATISLIAFTLCIASSLPAAFKALRYQPSEILR